MTDIDLKKIEEVESKKLVKNLDWFYHGFDFGDLANILEKGILAKKYLDFPTGNFGLNGKHYISVAKDTNKAGNALNKYKRNGPLVIVDNIKAIECKREKIYEYFRLTRLPLRYTEWDDEYQVYSKILPDKFVGLECMAYEWAKEGNIFLLRRLHSMLELMESLNCELPIYDYSREEDGIVHEIDKEAYLRLNYTYKF